MTPFALLGSASQRRPSHPAIVFGRRTITYADLILAAERRGRQLRALGVRPRERVGLLMLNSPAWLEWFFGISAAGAVATPVNPAYAPREIAAVLGVAGVRALVVDPRLGPRVPEDALREHDITAVIDAPPPAAAPGPLRLVAEAPDSPAVVFFSSGSTGTPKGIVHSATNLERIVASVTANWSVGEDDGVLVAMPLAFIYALVVECLATLSAGATVVLQERFDAGEAAALLCDGTITLTMGVPAMYQALATSMRGRPARLRAAATAGETLPPDLAAAFEAATGTPLLDFYGLTEVPHIIGHTPGADRRSRALSCGRPLPGVDARVISAGGAAVAAGEIGELLVRAPWMLRGYLGAVAGALDGMHEGWFATGDLVRQDEEGYVYVVDRKKDLIKRAGFNVVPAEVENVIRSLPGVREVAVVAASDREVGERVKACVVIETPAGPTRDEILGACRGQLAAYKVPEVVEFFRELPRGPTGKIARRQLRS